MSNFKLYVFLLFIFFISPAFHLHAQSTGNFMLGGGIDVIKSDINNIAEKAQFGAELNYFITRNFTVTGGVDIWTRGDDSFVLGMRWYPFNNFFLRFRGLIGANDNVVGAGISKPLDDHWLLDAMGDLYVDAGDVGFRVGIAYLFRPTVD